MLWTALTADMKVGLISSEQFIQWRHVTCPSADSPNRSSARRYNGINSWHESQALISSEQLIQWRHATSQSADSRKTFIIVRSGLNGASHNTHLSSTSPANFFRWKILMNILLQNPPNCFIAVDSVVMRFQYSRRFVSTEEPDLYFDTFLHAMRKASYY